MLIDSKGILDKQEIDERELEDVMAEIAFENAKTCSLSYDTCSSLKIGLSCTVIEFKSNQPRNITLCGGELGVRDNQTLRDNVYICQLDNTWTSIENGLPASLRALASTFVVMSS